jgi:hypothetical protein
MRPGLEARAVVPGSAAGIVTVAVAVLASRLSGAAAGSVIGLRPRHRTDSPA